MSEDSKHKILVADDCPTNLILVKKQLLSMGIEPILVQNPLDVLESAKLHKPDLILLDIMMPELSGFELCELLKQNEETKDIPVIFITAKTQTEDKVIGFKYGAVDYIVKPYNRFELQSRIKAHLDIVDLRNQILSMANTDKLSTLPNRRFIMDILEREVQRARQTHENLTVLMIDVDHFKKVNDVFGHTEGDNAIIHVSKIIKENIYTLDSAGRYGGEEFIIVMPGTEQDNAYFAAEKIRKLIEQSDFRIYDKRILITVSVGIATSNTMSQEELIKAADEALYSAKNGGRNRVAIWNPTKSVDADVQEDQGYRILQAEIGKLTTITKTQAMKTVSAFVKTMAARDNYIEKHARNTQYYSLLIAEQMGLSETLKDKLGTAALLHDLGIISIPDNILSKSEQLSREEKELIERHPLMSEEILSPLGIFECELPIIRQHHERIDGSGYPAGLVGREICIGAKILAVADCFDAMTSTRPYRTAMDFDSASKELANQSQTKFAPDVVNAFLKALSKQTCGQPQ